MVVHPKERGREKRGGGEGKVPVLTATLMASIWVFFGKKHLWILQLSYCQHSAAALTSSLCALPILTVSLSLWGYNWRPVRCAEVSRVAQVFDRPTDKKKTEKKC